MLHYTKLLLSGKIRVLCLTYNFLNYNNCYVTLTFFKYANLDNLTCSSEDSVGVSSSSNFSKKSSMTKDLLALQNISAVEFAIAGTPFHQETIKQITFT